MRSGKRILAAMLSVTLALSSVQLPASVSHAEELTKAEQESVQEEEKEQEDSGRLQEEEKEQEDSGQPQEEEKEQGDSAQFQEEEKEQENSGQLQEEEKQGDSGQLQEEEKKQEDSGQSQEDQKESEQEEAVSGQEKEETVAELPDQAEQVSGNDIQVSGNDLEEDSGQEIWVEAEIEGAYQFGGAPSAGDGIVAYSNAAHAALHTDEEIMDYLYEQMKARVTVVDVADYAMSADQVERVVGGVLNEHPDLYYVESSYRIGERGGSIESLSLAYNDTMDAAKWQQGVDAAMATVKPGMSDLQKAIVLHDYLLVNCEYDDENYVAGTIPRESYSTYGVFANRIAVCEGYALAYQYLLEMVGIECYMVEGETSSGAHAWNMIMLDGQYYHVDVTWDDTVPDRLGRARHRYIFRSDKNLDAAAMGISRHISWQVRDGGKVVDYQATDTRYDNAFWTKTDSPMVFDGDNCYCIFYDSNTNNCVLNRTSLSTISDRGEIILSIGRTWPLWILPNYSTPGPYTGLFQYNNRLYYNNSTSICSVAMDGKDQRTEFTADTAKGYICGSAFYQGKVFYYQDTAYLEGKILEADIKIDLPAEEDKALNLENLTAQYTTVDDTIVSTAAEGKPKLLIFYRDPNYGYTADGSVNTIQGISDRISAFAGVDIYAVEINGSTKEDAVEFQRMYGRKDIVFSYDTGSGNSSSMMAYAAAAGMSGVPSCPVIVYIDADNRLQYVTRAYSPAYTVLRNLKKYCNYLQINTITYILGGGKNNSENPSTYTSADTVITLQDPVKKGYRFEGWYADETYAAKVTQIYGEDERDITLYAKWSPLPDAEIPVVEQTLAEGNILMGISGTYATESAEKILDRLNAIRREACEEGVRNPDTNEPLTEADYVPLQWSAELEAIARLRAAESNVVMYMRPSGKGYCSAVTQSGEQACEEILAWDNDNLMAGIEQWYAQKDKWVSTPNLIGTDYEYMIRPSCRSVGVGAFRLSGDSGYAVALELGENTNVITKKDTSAGDCVQSIEVQGQNVTGLAFSGMPSAFLQEGDIWQLPVNVTAYYRIYNNGQWITGPYQAGGNWQSSDEQVAVVNAVGEVTAMGKGTAQVSMSAGAQSVSTTITVYGKDENLPITIKAPNRTTYKVGQDINLEGGTVTYSSGGQMKTEPLTADMVSGFASWKPGLCMVNVTVGGYTSGFETLIVEEPKLTASAGQKLSEIALPQNAYGTYTWQDETKAVGTTGFYTFAAVFTPNDTAKFQTLSDIRVQVNVQEMFGDSTSVIFRTNHFVYNGTEQEPAVVVRSSGVVLKEWQDYWLFYENNRNAGTAAVIVVGMGSYLGEIRREFEILPAPVQIRAKDKTILIGEVLPVESEYTYEISGLVGTDCLLKEPVISCAVTDTDIAGRYDIIPSGADAGANYTISYGNGRLTVSSEYVSHMVTFDVQGHGTAPAAQVDVRAGSTAKRPADPAAEGYRFDGWYRDAACTKVWDFDADIVHADLTLYAKWLEESKEEGGFAYQEIMDVCYTGKACKPAVAVYDGDVLLRSGRDYQIRYYNNINANKNDVMKKGNGEGINFDPELPYVEIIGKGDYTDKIKDGTRDTVKVNFNILRASIGDGTEKAAVGVTLRVSDQLATAKKVQKPFSSIKYIKGMKRDVDFRLRLTAENVRDETGKSLPRDTEFANAEIPKEYEGEFLLTVEGIGNYSGTIRKSVHVTDKAHLMKNATITLGRNLKNVTFTGQEVELTPSEEDSADTFTVKYGRTFLKPMRDYTVSYRDHDKVGKAELIITGNGAYAGTKAITFNIKGKAFSAKTVRVEELEDRVYTGRAQTQNGVTLTFGMKEEAPKTLRYGTDYTIAYAKNINKGTATMTFKGVEQAGYSGSFKKTFRIVAADLTDTEQVKRAEAMGSMSFPYCKAGVKPVEEIVLTNAEGFALQNGKDYTLKYQNNKTVAEAFAEKPPTVTIQGRGNYVGKFDVTFRIAKCSLAQAVEDGSVRIQTTSASYDPGRREDYAYKPAVKLKDGGTALRVNTDYEIEYRRNTQADCRAYLEAYRNAVTGGAADAGSDEKLQALMPAAVIRAKAGSSYEADGEIVVPLPVYQTKLTKRNLQITVEEAVYTGDQVTPAVTVRDTVSGKTLAEGKDYTLSYGANIRSGKNKGSVTVTGTAPEYGGSVTVKFEITKKELKF